MKINSFKALKVHGYLDFDITFYPDLTFLIGINGSGKTSALKLMLGLTSPSFHYLNQIEYDSCEVVCSSNIDEKDIIIRAEQNKDEGTFIIRLTLNNELFPIPDEPIKRFTRMDDALYDSEEYSLMEQRLKEVFDTLPVTRKIRELATPKFLGLDRRIYEGRLIDYRFKNKRQLLHQKYRRKNFEGNPEAPAIDTSLEEVQTLVFDYFRKIAQQQPLISDEFKQKIFRQSFYFVEDYNIEPIPLVEVIQERKGKVLKAIESLGIDYLDYSVKSFFTKIEDIARQNLALIETQKDPKNEGITPDFLKVLTKWYNNGSQLKRIDDIITFSQDYQNKIAELRAPIKRLEIIASNFLKEGKKELEIAPDGEIKVKLKNGKLANVYELSSGEKQIIIMIAHLIFEEDQRPSGIFIIDEPELSLHIAWQEIFVNSIIESSPKTQFILATHSPSIISKVDREKYCQDLNKLNY